MNKIFAIVLVTMTMIGTASADSYLTGSATRSDINVDGNSLDKSTGYVVGYGFGINNWVALEATYGQSGRVLSDAAEVKTLGAWLVVDPTIFKIGSMPVKAIARAGFVYNNVNVHSGANAYDTGYSYGGGFGLGITRNIDVVLDYRVMDIDVATGVDGQFDIVGLGLKFNF